MSLWQVWRDLENRLVYMDPGDGRAQFQGTPFKGINSPWVINRLVRAAFIVDPDATFELVRSADQFRGALEEAVKAANPRRH